MTTKIEQTLLGPSEPYYTIYARCDDCYLSWGWRDDDRKTTNYADLQAEVDDHNREHTLVTTEPKEVRS